MTAVGTIVDAEDVSYIEYIAEKASKLQNKELTASDVAVILALNDEY